MEQVLFKRLSKKTRDYFSDDDLNGFDMHFHTRYSMDGLSRIPNVIKKAAKRGIGVAITDHNQIRGSIACQHNRRNVPIIPGIEVTCKEGTHVLLYFYTHDELREFYTKNLLPTMKKNPFRAPITVSELLELSKDYNCVNSMAHPFAPGILNIKHVQITRPLIKNINNVEVLNGYNTHSRNIKAMMWADALNKFPTGGSDGHTTSELGKTLTFIKGATPEEVLNAIRKGRTKVLGKEENLLKKLILAVDKEGLFIKRSRRNKQTLLLLKGQFGGEFRYIRQSIRNRRSRKIYQFKKGHLMRGSRRKNIKKIIKNKR
ncbi:MAG: PHP domain-containing protein [Nanoarchaeota archaeon]|nr:PHP domain-containing protein [Nanoarchaeota archaeon]